MFLFDLTKGFFNVFRRNKKEGILERNGFIITVGERFKNLPSRQIFPVGKYYFKVITAITVKTSEQSQKFSFKTKAEDEMSYTVNWELWNFFEWNDWLFHDGGRYHTEISPLICRANHERVKQFQNFYTFKSSYNMKNVYFINHLLRNVVKWSDTL